MADFSAIESVEFDVDFHLANDLAQAKQTVAGHADVRALIVRCSVPDARADVFVRLVELAETVIDEEFAHPHDAALFAYLTALQVTDAGAARAAAHCVLRAKNAQWAHKLAREMLA